MVKGRIIFYSIEWLNFVRHKSSFETFKCSIITIPTILVNTPLPIDLRLTGFPISLSREDSHPDVNRERILEIGKNLIEDERKREWRRFKKFYINYINQERDFFLNSFIFSFLFLVSSVYIKKEKRKLCRKRE